jgi:hypothetical protein
MKRVLLVIAQIYIAILLGLAYHNYKMEKDANDADKYELYRRALGNPNWLPPTDDSNPWDAKSKDSNFDHYFVKRSS